MQRGAAGGEDELVALFAEDGEYIESFNGSATSHHGKQAIRTWLRASWADRPPDIQLAIEHITVNGEHVEATWRCESSSFAKPSYGVDRYTIRHGLIVRLETVVTTPPVIVDH